MIQFDFRVGVAATFAPPRFEMAQVFIDDSSNSAEEPDVAGRGERTTISLGGVHSDLRASCPQ